MGAILHIIGAGGYAKCIADAALSSKICDDIIFYDIAPNCELIMGFKVLPEAEFYEIPENSIACVGIGDNALREKIVRKIIDKRQDIKFPTIIHNNASISPFAKIGAGSVLLNGSVVGPCAIIGEHACLYSNAVLEHDAIIEDFVTLAPSANTGGNVKIGRRSFLGLGATINHGVSIGADTIIGAGANVIKDFAGEGILIGTPAVLKREHIAGKKYL